MPPEPFRRRGFLSMVRSDENGLITRRHDADGTQSEAVYSDCMQYRYLLTRIWDVSAKRALFVMLNPSTADEMRNDPTIERCERRSRALGFGAMRIANLFAFRATRPDDLRQAAAPVGPSNDALLAEACTWADTVICAWGVHGDHLQRDRQVADLIARSGTPMVHLGLTKHGLPRHPLYVAYAKQLENWSS